MFKHLFLGVGEGCAVAAIVVLTVRGTGADWGSTAIVYTATIVTGILVGLVAGRPVWKPGGKLEALIKSFVGAFIATTSMFGVRKWLPSTKVDLDFLRLGAGVLGQVPAASLPLVASALALVFEVDHAFGPKVNPAPLPPERRVVLSEPPASGEQRVDQSSARARTPRPRAGHEE
jgi:hypothetical protein